METRIIVITTTNNHYYWIGKASRIIVDQSFLATDLPYLNRTTQYESNIKFEYHLIIDCKIEDKTINFNELDKIKVSFINNQ
jgi:hypothetical protein